MASVILVTGSAGLIGSEAVRFFHAQGYEVAGIDNDMRAYFFGQEASTAWNLRRLQADCPRYRHYAFDIRDRDQLGALFGHYGHEIALVIHTAAQPSHDWAAREPLTDFTVNANGTLHLLEATRQHCPEAVFIFTSTNKVYGDTPNKLPLVEHEQRWEVRDDHPFAAHGIDETMSLDQTTHSLFGVSKVAADMLAQEYGRYFGLKTGLFRGGCLTGPAHSGAELHGFLAYLVLCAVKGKPYTINGYKGKQVRDNIHSHDLIAAFWQFFQRPRVGEVYNMGGSRYANVSILEAIAKIEELSGHRLRYTLSDQARKGDHIWYVSDVRKFQRHYPEWHYTYTIDQTLAEMIETAKKR
ncbi:MAG TPA: NAD-dependent epimerase/dehydratase family protein [Kouleothrix sp.]|uniref:NAD-dependent epimerase/dehydratase family protein n=1 Tax=Kouleothrix sp. TaxID=2779161 RepID=UPI002C33AEA4|nr:NAD-dependent epimerase/dehydratase family protein [Kouleothrix sp.]HRC75835.1 NAD-dependent epimerase/dehydratase family protein [Kouleothrix sp.]